MTAAASNRRSRLRGLFVRGLAWSLALLAVVTLAVWAFVESAWVRERARAAVVVQAGNALEREVLVGRLDFDLWPPRVTLEEVSVAGASDDRAPLLTAERVTVGFGPGLVRALRGRGVIDLRSIDVLEPHVRVEIHPDGSTDLPPILERIGRSEDRSDPALEVRLGAVHLTRGRLELDDRSIPLDLDAVGVRAVVARLARAASIDSPPAETAYRLRLDSRRVTAGLPALDAEGATERPSSESDSPDASRPPVEVRLALEADFTGGRVEVSRLTLGGDRLDLRGSGSYREGRVEASVSGHVDLAVLEAVGWVDRFAGLGGRPEGVLSLDGRGSFGDGAWRVVSDLATSPVAAGPRRLPALTGSVDMAGRGGEIETLAATATGAPLDLTVSGSYTAGRLALDLEGWVDAELGAALGVVDDLDGRIAFDGQIESTADRWELTADLASEEVRYDTYVLRRASARVGATPSAVRAEEISAVAAGGSIGGTVVVDLEPPAREPSSPDAASAPTPTSVRTASPPAGSPADPPSASPAGAASLAASFPSSDFPVVSLDLDAVGIDVRRFVEMAELPVRGLAGRVSGELIYVFATAEPRSGRGRGRLAFEQLDVDLPSTAEGGPLQLAGRVPFEIDGGTFRVARAELRAPGQSVLLSGRLDLGPESEHSATGGSGTEGAPSASGPAVEAEFELDTENPRRVLRLLPALYETDPEPLWEPQRGRGTVRGRLSADAESFAVALDLDLENAAVAATEADRLRGTVVVDSAGVQAADLEFLRHPAPAASGASAGEGEGLALALEDADRSIETFSERPAADEAQPAWDGRLALVLSVPFIDVDTDPGTSRLDSGAGTASAEGPSGPRSRFEAPPFSVRISTTRWPLADAAPWLPFELPADGSADLEVELEGSLEAISGRLEGSVSEPVLAGVALGGTLTGAAAFTPEELVVEWAALDVPAGRLELGGTYGIASEALDIELSSGPLDLASAPFGVWVEAPLGGVVTVAAHIGGTLSEPALVAEVVGDELALGERALGRGGRSRLDLAWRGGDLSARGSLLGLVRLEGGGRLDASGADIAVAVASDEVGSLVELVAGTEIEEMGGAFDGTLRIAGPTEALTARLTFDRFSLEQPSRRLANLEPVVVAWNDGVLRLESLYMGEERSGTELFVAGDLVGADGGLDLVLQSSIDARWLALYLPDVTLAGQVNLLGVVRGSLAEPALDGQADLAGARMIVRGFPHAFERMSGLLFFYPDRIVIDSGTARLAGGRIRADGVVDMAPDELWGFELRFRAEEIDLRYPEDWRLQGGAELTLSGSVESRELTGVVTLERAEYQRDFKLGLMGLLRSLFERRTETVRETDELLVDTKLNVLVEGAEALYVTTNLADIQGDLDLSVRGSLAEPVLLGDVRLLRGGRIDIGGSEYEVERGTLSFSNPFRNAPRLDLVASAQVKEFDVRLNVYGPLEKLETTFSSNPPLPDVDIVSLLATGSADTLRTFGSDGLLSDPTAGAETFLAGQAASLAGERVGTLIGLDQVQISPLTGGTADLSTARLTVGKRLGRDLFVTYSYDPSRSREEVYELSWQINPSLALILTRSDEGNFAVDLKWNTTF